MAITAQKLLPSKKTGAIVPIKKRSITSIAPISLKKSSNESEDEKKDILIEIKNKCIEIDTLLKGSLALEKIRDDQKRKEKEKTKRIEKEDKLEKDPKQKEKTKTGINLPKISFFDKMKNFIKNVLLGFVITRLLKFAPQLAEFLKFLAPVGDFIIKTGGFLLNGLVTFVDKGYEIYDSARKFVGDKFGDDILKNFDELSKNVNIMLNLALIGAMGSLAFGGKGKGKGKGKTPKVKPKVKTKPKTKGRVKIDKKLKKMGLTKEQIKAYNKAVGGGANTTGALAQAKKVKPKLNFFQRLGQNITDRYKSLESSVSGGLKKLGDSAKTQIVDRVLGPVRKLIDPLLKPAEKIYDKLSKKIVKLPGVGPAFKKIGISSLGDAGKIAGKFGAKALPIVGGIFNLLFAYDRLADGDSLGALIEFISAILDFSGVGAPFSMALDAFMFARDMFPQIRESEDSLIKGIGADGMITKLNEISSRLPNLSTLIKNATGADKDKSLATSITQNVTGSKPKSKPKPKPATPTGVSDYPNQKKNIYLHWTAGGYNSVVGPYHTIFTGDGTKHNRVDYSSTSGHTYKRNTNSIGLALASMGGGSNESNMSQAPTDDQINAMAKESANLATNWGWTKNDINIKNVMTHGEAGSNKDGKIMHENYGPSIWGGTGERWDLDKLRKGQAIGQGGPEMRERIKGFMGYSKGGFTKSGTHQITVGEEGREFVLDADSTAALEGTFPGFLSAINKADGKAATNVLRAYAEYDMPQKEFIEVPVEVPVESSSGYNNTNSSPSINVLVRDDQFSQLYRC
jgi:hypothetical protein